MAGDQERARRAYEEMNRRLAELDQQDGIDLTPPPALRPHRVRWRRLRRPHGGVVSVVLTVAVVVTSVWASGGWRQVVDPTGALPPIAAPPAPESGSAWPPVPGDASAQRLAAQVQVGSAGAHEFIDTLAEGRPVTYDPCRPLHYVVNPDRMPGGALALVREAAASVAAATGLVLTEDGVVDEPWVADRELVQPQRYGDRWAPVLLAWSDAGSTGLLGGEIAGVGGSSSVVTDGPGSRRLVTGSIVLDREDFAEILDQPDGLAHARAIVMHELGHVVGLDHVGDPAELMNAENTGQLDWGPGDRQGLAALGAGSCHTDT